MVLNPGNNLGRFHYQLQTLLSASRQVIKDQSGKSSALVGAGKREGACRESAEGNGQFLNFTGS